MAIEMACSLGCQTLPSYIDNRERMMLINYLMKRSIYSTYSDCTCFIRAVRGNVFFLYYILVSFG